MGLTIQPAGKMPGPQTSESSDEEPSSPKAQSGIPEDVHARQIQELREQLRATQETANGLEAERDNLATDLRRYREIAATAGSSPGGENQVKRLQESNRRLAQANDRLRDEVQQLRQDLVVAEEEATNLRLELEAIRHPETSDKSLVSLKPPEASEAQVVLTKVMSAIGVQHPGSVVDTIKGLLSDLDEAKSAADISLTNTKSLQVEVERLEALVKTKDYRIDHDRKRIELKSAQLTKLAAYIEDVRVRDELQERLAAEADEVRDLVVEILEVPF